jgi:hypothetical protein
MLVRVYDHYQSRPFVDDTPYSRVSAGFMAKADFARLAQMRSV